MQMVLCHRNIHKPDDFSIFGHNRDLLVMNLHHRVHIFIIRILEQNDFLFNGIAISNKAELRFPYTGQVMDFTPDYSTSYQKSGVKSICYHYELESDEYLVTQKLSAYDSSTKMGKLSP